MRVGLEGVWFASGVVGGLKDGCGGDVEVVGANGGGAEVERGLTGVGMERHLGDLGLGGPLEEGGEWGVDTSVLMREVLGGLDHFSPTEFWFGDDGADGWWEKGQCADSLDAEGVAIGAYGGEGEAVGDEEELTEEDDVSDDEMLDIDDFDAILGNLGDVAQNMAVERDICYLTNFAPGVLGGW